MSLIRRRPGDLGRRGGVLKGCLVVLVIVVVLAVIAGIYVAMHLRGWTASAITAISEQAVAKADLPQNQKDRILVDVHKVSDDFKSGKITVEQLRRIGTEIGESPLLPLGAVLVARQKYIDPSDLTAEEKAAATLALQRFARGVYEKKIAPAEEQINDVVKPIATLKPNGRWEFKDKPTREELDQFVAAARKKADEAGVPDEPYDLDIAEELHKAIDRALGKTAGG